MLLQKPVTPEEALIALMTPDEKKALLQRCDEIPVFKASAGKPFTLKRALRGLYALWHIVTEAGARQKKEFKVVRDAMAVLKRAERELHVLLAQGDVSAEVQNRNDKTVFLSPGMWPNLEINFYNSKVEYFGRVRYFGLRILPSSGHSRVNLNTQKRGRGRPSPKDLYLAKFQRRCLEKQVEASLKKEANKLMEYMKEAAPEAAVSYSTIQNNIRHAFKAYKARN